MLDKDIVNDSYGTCCLSPGFFDDFYTNFLSSSPEIAPKFARTNMSRQKQLLREGISFMIMYYGGAAMAETKVRGLGLSHSQARLDIEPRLYALWVDSLMKTVAAHDPQFNRERELAWRRVLERGISLMQSMYATGEMAAAR